MRRLPKLRLLKDEIKRFGLPVRFTPFRTRAVQLSACYLIDRRVYVTAAQLVQVIESWVRSPPTKMRQPVEKHPVARLSFDAQRAMERIAQAQREAAERRSTANARRSLAMKEHHRDRRKYEEMQGRSR